MRTQSSRTAPRQLQLTTSGRPLWRRRGPSGEDLGMAQTSRQYWCGKARSHYPAQVHIERQVVGIVGARAEAEVEDLCRLADLSLAAYARHLAHYGGATSDRDGLLLFAGAHSQPNPYRNGALRLDDRTTADEVLRRAGDFFGELGRGYALWVREHGDADLEAAAREAQLAELERLPELVLYELPQALPLPDGVELRQALDEQTRNDYLEVVASAWGMAGVPHALAAKVFFAPDSLDAPNVAAFVAYFDGQALSGAMTLVTDGVALGCQAATIRRPKPGQKIPPPGASKGTRSLAQSCLVAALRLSFDELDAEFSLCQTSALGAPVWLQLGYEPFTSYGRYVVPAGQRAT